MSGNGDSPTDIGQPQKPTRHRHHVRVDLHPSGDATITSKDGTIVMTVPATMVAKRLLPGETRAYFEGWIRAHGALDIGDRLPPTKAGW